MFVLFPAYFRAMFPALFYFINSRSMSRQKRRRLRRVTGPALGVGEEDDEVMQPGFGPPQGQSREELHALWETKIEPEEAHFDLGRGGLGPAGAGALESIAFIPTGGIDGSLRNRVDSWVVDAPDAFYGVPPTLGEPIHQPINLFRRFELTHLHEDGELLASLSDLSQEMRTYLRPDSVFEPRWRFDGMADNDYWQLGAAWSIFRYTISDLFVGGHATGADLMLTLKDIFFDIKSITQGIVDENSIFLLYFESEVDGGGPGEKPTMYYTRRGFTFAEALQNDFQDVLNQLTEAWHLIQESDPEYQFYFYRVYVAVITNLPPGGGGALQYMPEAMKKLREGPLHKGRNGGTGKRKGRGYVAIENDDEGDCGLMAILFALANATRRIRAACKTLGMLAPSICKSLLNFATRLESKSKKTEKIKLEMLLEMATAAGWEKGTNITPNQLCMIVRHLNQKYKLDLGLLIFNAIHPLKDIFVSYDTKAFKIPAEKLCLIHWKYMGREGRPDGHYDVIYPNNLAAWIQTSKTKRHNMTFDFRTLRMTYAASDEKGELCDNCNYWESEIDKKLWESEHKKPEPHLALVFYKECKECGVRFAGKDCYDRHLTASQGQAKTACVRRRACKLCKKIHAVSYNCQEFFCFVCKTRGKKHERSKHVCYIQNSSDRKRKKVENVIYSDCEGSRKSGYHQAVCVASVWTCLCAEHKSMAKKAGCEECKRGEDYYGPFCEGCVNESGYLECKECQSIQENIFHGENCIIQYMEWLETTFDKCTVVFHNGGRYDFHLLYLELLKSGKYYVKKEAERGTQIIFMSAGLMTEEMRGKKSIEFKFIDSFNFIHFSLRSFPSMFTIDSKLFSKGRFPYDLLNTENWENYVGACPDYKLFGITDLEWKSQDKLNKSRQKDIQEIAEYIQENKGMEWKAFEKLCEYVLQDVKVLHAGMEQFRQNYWDSVGADPFHWVTLPSAVAGTYRLSSFMPKDSIQVFDMPTREWQRKGLRGGRCEPFKLYWKASSEQEEIKVYDVNSEYPAAQIYGYAPYGKVTWDKEYKEPTSFYIVGREFKRITGKNIVEVLNDPTGKSGNGMIECVVEAAFSHYPILPLKVTREHGYTKNLFMVRSGVWCGFISVLAEAIVHHQVIVTLVKRIQFWSKTSDRLFRAFLPPVYAGKVEASGWKKILGTDTPTEEEVDFFIGESKRQGIEVDTEKIKDNPGIRSTNKVIVNCGWGYLCQKPHATDILYFNNESKASVGEMGEFLVGLDTEEDTRRLMGAPMAIGQFTRVKVNKEPLEIKDKEMNAGIAYQVGGCAPAWGLQLLSREILKLHPNQPVYCDTDSLFFVYHEDKVKRGVYSDIKTGPFLGNFVDEYPHHRVVEFVSIGPKSYFYKLVERKTGKTSYVGRFKGLPYMSSCYSMLDDNNDLACLGMEQMKKILFSAYIPPQDFTEEVKEEEEGEEKIESIRMKFHYTNFFKRGHDFKIRTVQESKTLQFTFDKRRVLWPKEKNHDLWTEVNTTPFVEQEGERCSEEVMLWWDNMRNKFNLH